MGFALALAARFMAERSAAGLILAEDFALHDTGALHGPGLVAHGLELGRLVFVRAPNAPALFLAMEEALKSGAPAVVVGELWTLRKYDLSVSRRLLLAARSGAAPALIVQASAYGAADRISSAAETRFEISAAPSAHLHSAGGGRGLPGPPSFSARLVKARLSSARGAPARPGCRKDHPPDLEKRGQAVCRTGDFSPSGGRVWRRIARGARIGLIPPRRSPSSRWSRTRAGSSASTRTPRGWP